LAINFGDILGGAKWMAGAARSAMSSAGQKMNTSVQSPAPSNQQQGQANQSSSAGLGGAAAGLLGSVVKELGGVVSQLTGTLKGGVGKAEGAVASKFQERGKELREKILADPAAAGAVAKETAGNLKGVASKASPFLAAGAALFGDKIPGLSALATGAGILSNPIGALGTYMQGPVPGQKLAGGIGLAGSLAGMAGMSKTAGMLGTASKVVGVGGRILGGAGDIAGGVGSALSGGETTAEQGIKGVASGIKGVGKMLGPTPLGLAVTVIGKLGEVVAESLEKLRAWNKELYQANIKFAEFSSSMAQVKAEQEVRDIEFSQERGEARAGSAEFQARQMHKLNQSMADVEDLLADIKNVTSGILSTLGSSVVDAVKYTNGLYWAVRGIKFIMEKTSDEEAAGKLDDLLAEAAKPGWNSIYGRPDRFGGPGGGKSGREGDF
jgi:hypothetical protein